MKDIAIQFNEDPQYGEIMDLKIIPKRDYSGKIISGIVIGSTLEQNKALVLIAHQGDLKFRADLGVGIEDLLLSSEYLKYRHKIRDHFSIDGLKITQLDLYENKEKIIKAFYDES